MPNLKSLVFISLTGCFSFVWRSELDKAPAIAVPSPDAGTASWDDVSSSGDHYQLSVAANGGVCVDRSGQGKMGSALKPSKLELSLYVSNKADLPTEDTPHFAASRKAIVSWECAQGGQIYRDHGNQTEAQTLYDCQYKYSFCFDGAAPALQDAQYATFVWGNVRVTEAGKRDIVRIRKSS